jgi:hypothetical protein
MTRLSFSVDKVEREEAKRSKNAAHSVVIRNTTL